MHHRELPLLTPTLTLVTTLNGKYDYPHFTDEEIWLKEEKQLIQDL